MPDPEPDFEDDLEAEAVPNPVRQARATPKGLVDPEELQSAPEGKPLHTLQVPSVRPMTGPVMAATKNVEVLTALENWAMFARVPRKKTVQAGILLSLAIRLNSQEMFSLILSVLQMHTSEDGYRSEQAKDVLIAEKQAQHRADAFSKLARMGPQPTDRGEDAHGS